MITAFKNDVVWDFIEQRIAHASNCGIEVVGLKMEMFNQKNESLSDQSKQQVHEKKHT